MKFETESTDKTSEVVAELYYMVGGLTDSKEKVLCIKTIKKDKFIWMYEEGDITIQNVGFATDPIKRFYKGDKITITF